MTHACVFLVSAALFVQTAASPAQAPPIRMDGYPAVNEPPMVTVLERGAAPLQELRYVIPRGHKARMDMTMTMSMAMDIGGTAVPVDMPPIKFGVDVAVTDVATNGDVSFDIRFTSMTVESAAGADPAMAQAIQAASAGVTSIKGTTTVSNRGITRSAKLDVGDPTMRQMIDQMKGAIENLSMPFPVEAVGRGARWETRQTIAGAQTTFQKAVFEVVSIEGGVVSLKVKAEQVAPPQPVANPALPSGAEMRLEKLTGSGSGTVAIRLDSVVPTSQMDAISTVQMTMTMGGQTQPVSMETKLKVSVGPAKDK
jgi:hypothetical protein